MVSKYLYFRALDAFDGNWLHPGRTLPQREAPPPETISRQSSPMMVIPDKTHMVRLQVDGLYCSLTIQLNR
jgi:hypothetical protein